MKDIAKRFFGGQVSDPVVEASMIDYVVQWMVDQGRVQTPQDIVRLLARVDGESNPLPGQRSLPLLQRAYNEAVRHRRIEQRML